MQELWLPQQPRKGGVEIRPERRRVPEWHGTTKIGRQERQLPLPEAHRAGESLDSREDLVYTLGRKAGLTKATSSHVTSIYCISYCSQAMMVEKCSWCLNYVCT